MHRWDINDLVNLQSLNLPQNRYTFHFFCTTMTGFLDQHRMTWRQWLHRRAKPSSATSSCSLPPQGFYITGAQQHGTLGWRPHRELNSVSWHWCNCMQRDRLLCNFISAQAAFSPWWMLLTWYGYGQTEQRLDFLLNFDTTKTEDIWMAVFGGGPRYSSMVLKDQSYNKKGKF